MRHQSRLWHHPFLSLSSLARYEDVTLLLLRLMVGTFLVWGVADNILSAERMAEFEAFLKQHGFALPGFMAPLSVWVQCLTGLAFILGVLTRWAGLLCGVNFLVAIIMVDAQHGIRAAFPAACLVLIGLHLAARGAGVISIDALITGPTSRS